MIKLSTTSPTLKQAAKQAAKQADLTPDATVQALLNMLYLRGCQTKIESQRLEETTMKLASLAGMPAEEMESLRIGALLHDIGKIAIPDQIIFKQSTLNDKEWEIMRKHPQYAYELMSPIPFFCGAALDIPYCHHELWDGTGYPRGLSGNDIPLGVRIFTIVDLWDALSSTRPQRTSWTAESIRFYLQHQAGVSLDPDLVALFLKIMPRSFP